MDTPESLEDLLTELRRRAEELAPAETRDPSLIRPEEAAAIEASLEEEDSPHRPTSG